jgi:hypothetical protein
MLAPAPNLAEFTPPKLTIELDTGSEPIGASDTLLPEEAAQIGAKYIWAMVGESIDGMTVRLSYMNAEWSVRSYWQGTVIDLEPGENFGWMPFIFEIDAVTGEWLDISNHMAISGIDRADIIVTEELRYRLQKTLTPDEIRLYLDVANEYAARHFQESRTSNFMIQEVVLPFAFARDAEENVIATAYIIRIATTDDTGRDTMIMQLCSQTLQLIDIRSFSDPNPDWVYDNPNGVG